MNWGKGIVIGMGLFIAFITFLVVNLVSQTVDLESEDYYKREINYEQEIAALTNANQLKERIKVTTDNAYLIIQLPNEIEVSEVEVGLIRPDDQKLDKKYTIRGTKSFLISKSELKKGAYNLEIVYKSDSKPCMQKETVYI